MLSFQMQNPFKRLDYTNTQTDFIIILFSSDFFFKNQPQKKT